jgi:ribonuclease HI
MSTLVALYADGGVIGSNPSTIGGTYAYRLLFEDGQAIGKGSVIAPQEVGGPVTNNQTEMLAMLEGLKRLPDHFAGCIFSDSQVTLGRVFMGWKWKNIPTWMHKVYQEQRARLIFFDQIQYVLLDGHPTRQQLQLGIGKRGHPVSEHNVWCDHECNRVGREFLNQGADYVTSIVTTDAG